MFFYIAYTDNSNNSRKNGIKIIKKENEIFLLNFIFFS